MTLDKIKEHITELEGLMMCIEDRKHYIQKMDGIEHTDFAYHMATALNGVDDACDELKKIATQMEASDGN